MDRNHTDHEYAPDAVPARTRVLIVDDESLSRGLLEHFISRNHRFKLVGAVSCAEDAYRVAESSRPDVVLLDSGLGEGPDTVTVARSLKAANPATGIVILVADNDRDRIARATASRRGVWTVLLKQNMRDAATLLRAIDGAAWGLTSIDPGLLAPPRRSSTPLLERLTATQVAVLRDIAAGYSDDALAARHLLTAARLQRLLATVYADLHIRPDGRQDQRVQAVLTYLRETANAPGA